MEIMSTDIFIINKKYCRLLRLLSVEVVTATPTFTSYGNNIQYIWSKDEHVNTQVRIIIFTDWRFYENNGAGLWLSYSWCGN